MLTARNEQTDILTGFRSGTDDYLPKPFDFEELILRVQALIKRNYKDTDSILRTNDVEVNTTNRRTYKGGIEVKLNAKEYGVLEYLLRNRGKIVSQEELLEHVWDNSIDMFTDTIRANIKTLRQKLDKDKSILRTVRGMGYVID
jgi:DNA-binding response OmpR family regulator